MAEKTFEGKPPAEAYSGNSLRGRLEIVRGSITQHPADAIVCPANRDLELAAMAGGLQFSFLMDGGAEIFREAREYRDAHGKMVDECTCIATNPGRLPAKYVIHAVSAAYDQKKRRAFSDPDIIYRTARAALELADEKGLKSVSFPALGTGLYGVPVSESVQAILSAASRHMKGKTGIEKVSLVLFSKESFAEAESVFRLFEAQA